MKGESLRGHDVMQGIPQKETLKKALAQYHEAQRYEIGYRPNGLYLSDYQTALTTLHDELSWENGRRMMTCLHPKEESMDNSCFVPGTDPQEYRGITYAKASGAEKDFEPYPTRTLYTLRDQVLSSQKDTDAWGGEDGRSFQKTGWFHVEKSGQRWYMVDPDGNSCYQTAICSVGLHTSDHARKAALDKYGTLENWAEKTAERLHELGFTAAGNWSDTEHLTRTSEPIGVCGRAYFITSYAEKKGIARKGIGHKVFGANNAMPVFDRDFETYAARYALETMGPYRDSNRIAGWFSDNELPTNLNMLERFLTLDPQMPEHLDSLTTVWTFLKYMTGMENPSLSDVTDELSESFRGLVYERYFSVVREAIRSAAPMHLYLGCRFSYAGKQQQGGRTFSRPIFAAAGRWCDVVSVNYYFAWTPDAETVGNWLSWAGKPLIISEWYAMAIDSGLPCSIGGGFKVRTQEDRAAYYQNFALWLLECPGVIGFHWLMYLDNDPHQKGAELSNINGNKGIFSIDLEEYTVLTSAMKEINERIPELVAYFDRRNSIQD